MGTDVHLFEGYWPGAAEGASPAGRSRGRMTRAQRRAQPRPVAVAWLGGDGPEVLERLTERPDLLLGLPIMMSWKPCGRFVEVVGAELGELHRELLALGLRAGVTDVEQAVLAELGALVATARARDLTLVVMPD